MNMHSKRLLCLIMTVAVLFSYWRLQHLRACRTTFPGLRRFS